MWNDCDKSLIRAFLGGSSCPDMDNGAIWKCTARRGVRALFGGILCTLTVAWCSALFLPLNHDAARVSAVSADSLPAKNVLVLQRAGASRAFSYQIGSPPSCPNDEQWSDELNAAELEDLITIYGVDPEIVPKWGHAVTSNELLEVIDDGRGWPFLALASSIVLPTGASNTFSERVGVPTGELQSYVRGGLAVPARSGSDPAMYRVRILPLTPVWGGLVADVALYSAVVWIIICLSAALLHLVRRTRELCTACGYDRRGSVRGTCPECGRPAP